MTRARLFRRTLYGVLAVAVAAAGLLLTQEATALSSRADVKPASYRSPAYNAPMLNVKVASVTFNVAAGQAAYINSSLKFGNATTRILVDNQVECFNNKGTSVRKLLRSQNVYAAGNGALSTVALTTRFLLPTATAASFRCDLSLWTRSLGDAGRVGLMSGFVEVAGKYAGTTQAATTGRSLVTKSAPVWAPAVKGSASVPKTTGLWQAPGGATSLSVFGDAQLTTCYGKDKAPCPVTANDKKGSLVRTTLVATQFKKDGSVCKTSTVSSDVRIPQYVHHQPVYLHNPKVPVLTGSGCLPVFSVYLKHQLLADHPYYVHGSSDDAVVSVIPV
ncbi:hypothetical protein [Phytomonospora endophytica]|uniref:Uncharacterized protein n=1 Tax=Phytomonospora endophytica TaxID=714109 RepID=A0A841G268_9ACTN|nr:hypothetical protein [Phytomonospora endophytica]MBB6039862.1 hypothetical protein [Phytomonospora endophytica]GIG70282.1 hypothetical protein Pen01_65770 [Phytomonospora endophytica]